jgi:hypothetical protein
MTTFRFWLLSFVSCGHCIACPSVLISTFGILWSLYCLSFSSNFYHWYLVVIVLPVLQFLFLPLVSCGHCICLSFGSNYYLRYLVVIVFACPSVLIITFGISWSLYCLSFGYNYYLRYLVVIVFACTSVLITTFGISERFLQIMGSNIRWKKCFLLLTDLNKKCPELYVSFINMVKTNSNMTSTTKRSWGYNICSHPSDDHTRTVIY